MMEGPLLERFDVQAPRLFLDTRELTWLAVPYLRDHSLASLASSLLGEDLTWRAADDARLLLDLLYSLGRIWEEAPRRLREAMVGALQEADSPWRFFLPGRPGRKPYPDLTDIIPRIDLSARQDAEEPATHRSEGGVDGAVDLEEVLSILAPGGALASCYPHHEARPQQSAMAKAVASAFNDSAFLAAEAGTGVGKSLAYLVPGVLHARRGNGPLVVSTYTRNLQEQLFQRDLPLLSRSLGSFEFSLLKGRRNYLCLRKWSEWCYSLSRQEPTFVFTGLAPALAYAYLASWISRTTSGDLEEISLDLRGLISGLLRDLSSSFEDCLRPYCRNASRCWVEQARYQAAMSDVVVVNHALLLSQLAAAEEGPAHLILPEHRLLVVDEAHHLEDVATDAFALSFSWDEGRRMLEEIGGSRGILTRWRRLSLGQDGEKLLSDAQHQTDLVREEAEDFFLFIQESFLASDSPGRAGMDEPGQCRITRNMVRGPRWERAQEKGLDLAVNLQRLSSMLADLAARTIRVEGDENKMDARRGETLAVKAYEAAAALKVFTREPDDEMFQEHLRWAERIPGQKKGSAFSNTRINSAPVSVGQELSSLLFGPLDSAVLTSASLRVPGGREGFAFLLRRTGLDLLEERGREIRLMSLDSPFDYASQVRLIAVTDLPEPSAGKKGFRRYMTEISKAVEEALMATSGKALVLLTSHQQVGFLDSDLRPRLEERGLSCLRQRRGVPNALLLERFRMDRDSVLLATDAFWEGVDVPGEALSAVVVVKLPFRHPEDPVVAGRTEYHDLTSGGGWGSYYAPLAVTLFRQGIGRLVRRSSDRGLIVVLDPRFLNRSYSRLFQSVLPRGLEVEAVSRHELGETIQRSFPPGGS
jgi:ATP-dependent DNA helicase DinG